MWTHESVGNLQRHATDDRFEVSVSQRFNNLGGTACMDDRYGGSRGLRRSSQRQRSSVDDVRRRMRR